MKEPILAVLAAGMGSRYGGLKQIDPVGPGGEILIDYSIHDAIKAGFRRVVFIIKPELKDSFEETIAARVRPHAEVSYAFQELSDLPEGFTVPEGRVKPWGTAHALAAARDIIDAPFAVINADDYYGPNAYKIVYDFLKRPGASDGNHFMLVAYPVGNTVTEHGSVARGVCEVGESGYLESIYERLNISVDRGGVYFEQPDGVRVDIPKETPVSMNLWGLTPGYITGIAKRFPEFLRKELPINPQKSEYLLPSSIFEIMSDGEADVIVKTSPDNWYGVTYKEDRPRVAAALKAMHDTGIYPTPLWDDMDAK